MRFSRSRSIVDKLLQVAFAALVPYALCLFCLWCFASYRPPTWIKLAGILSVAIVSQLILASLQSVPVSRRRKLDFLCNSIGFCLMFSLYITADAFLLHPALARNVPVTIPGVILYFTRLFGILSMPMTLLNWTVVILLKTRPRIEPQAAPAPAPSALPEVLSPKPQN